MSKVFAGVYPDPNCESDGHSTFKIDRTTNDATLHLISNQSIHIYIHEFEMGELGESESEARFLFLKIRI